MDRPIIGNQVSQPAPEPAPWQQRATKLLHLGLAVTPLVLMTYGSIELFQAGIALLRTPMKDVFEVALLYALLFWLAVFWVVTAILTFVFRRSRWPFRLLAAALLPLPVTVLVLAGLTYDNTLLKHRFADSRAEFDALIAEYETKAGGGVARGRVGEFTVSGIVPRSECLFVYTDHVIDEAAGFAYCAGDRPERPNLTMRHLEDDWWSFYHIDGID